MQRRQTSQNMNPPGVFSCQKFADEKWLSWRFLPPENIPDADVSKGT